MAEHRDRLTYTLSLQRMLDMSDIVFIAVDTPPTYSGDADLSRVWGWWRSWSRSAPTPTTSWS